MIAKETQIKVDETIQALCKDIKETVESYSSNGTRAMELKMLPELINSVANLVQSTRGITMIDKKLSGPVRSVEGTRDIDSSMCSSGAM